MFRPLTRQNKAATREECLRLLETEKRGVLSVIGDDGYPYGMPMNHFYDPENGCIWFHAGHGGHREEALRRCGKASFCVYDEGWSKPGDWVKHVLSVIVFGRVEFVDDMDEIARVGAALSRKFIQDEEHIRREIAASGPQTVLLKLIPEHICGKHVTEE